MYELSQNYPNPFNPTTTLSYAIPRSGDVTLIIYNILGEEIISLVNEFKSAGRYEITWDASAQSSGIYFYRLKSGDFEETKKMVLLK
ncbi:T9SS type A sorting domain-containing protein [Candidatus Marinimicrobia bacterium MT.SAG.2]|nr:T9SS type A sorting domain-containing protein [Candidatus Marinimicrobia bacterium MT.SAG.2]